MSQDRVIRQAGVAVIHPQPRTTPSQSSARPSSDQRPTDLQHDTANVVNSDPASEVPDQTEDEDSGILSQEAVQNPEVPEVQAVQDSVADDIHVDEGQQDGNSAEHTGLLYNINKPCNEFLKPYVIMH